ncbi:Mitochondrial nuclease [Micractinium conductrix]|uniref:Mitochondrial nuclease n=1 Tax=Micractinium conductrix TaxID=554055 RepID=A0A2P6VNI3_9CHLO|nr:Mitochondrial nuclease [Micractinium conductrix]|eukprot:PSC75639.1 Mitochondrial nuclease [Micractinium conductrix]
MASRQLVVGAVVGAGLGGAATFFYLRHQQQQAAPAKPRAAEFAPPGAAKPMFKYGMPVGDRLRLFSDYAASFDTRLRNPRWVLEHVTAAGLAVKGGTRADSQFQEDAGIERRFRSKLEDFRGSGFDRGHMAPAANHKGSQAAMDDTFTLTNMSPQVGAGFNRDYWARFERFVQDLAKRCDDVWIVTGPLYLPQRSPTPQATGAPGYHMQHPMIGTPPQLMAVPSHYFKVVLGEYSGGRRAAVGAFVMPNAAIDPEVPLASFAVPIGALEEVAGLRFFPGYLSDVRREAVDETALVVQAIGASQLRRIKPGMPQQPPLLPAPAGATPAPALPAAAAMPADALAPAALPPTDQRRAAGAVHVCEHTECKLPAERFWESNGGGKGGKGKRELRRTSSGGFCGSLLTRNPGANPSTSWAGLFTFSGGELTTGPNGNGVSEKLGANQWTFVPNDPAQMAIFPNSTVMVTFCCNAPDNAQVQASFRAIFSYDYRGVGYNPPPPSPPSPPPPSPPSPRPPPPAPRPPPPSPPAPPTAAVPAPAPVQPVQPVAAQEAAPAPAPATDFAITEAASLTAEKETEAPPAVTVPPSGAARAAQAAGMLLACAAAAVAALLA